MTILAYLGWKSFPVARLGTDHNARHLLDDLKDCGVETKFIRRAGTGATPVIVVRVTENEDGQYRSRFEWRHPQSGGRLPAYRPLPKALAEHFSHTLPSAHVFYFDRAVPSSLLLATEMRKRGAVVFFEPSSCKDERMFTACMAVSDIVKYSADRIAEPPKNPESPSPRLEIQTLGSHGLRYRLKQNSNKPGPWKDLEAFSVNNFKDATGCGDWCSAGLIYQIGTTGRDEFLRLNETKIATGLRFGQALAAVNCQFEGARGPMYEFSGDELIAQAEKFITPDQSEKKHRSHFASV